jgi:hypothetical protein
LVERDVRRADEDPRECFRDFAFSIYGQVVNEYSRGGDKSHFERLRGSV